MPKVIKVPHSERGSFAAFLFALVDENDLDRKADVKSANGGYELSDRLWDLVHPEVDVVKLTDVYTEAEIAEAAATSGAIFVESQLLAEAVASVALDNDPEVGTYTIEGDSWAVDPRGDEEKAYPILTPDVVEGAPASHNVDRETIRLWAKEQGLQVADKGQLKKAIIEAYDAAHSA